MPQLTVPASELAALGLGEYPLRLRVVDTGGLSSDEVTTLTIADLTAPTLQGVKVASSTWDPFFVGAIDPVDSQGWLLEGSGQLRNLSWTGIDTIFLKFSEDIGGLNVGDFSLLGVNIADYASSIGSVDYDSASFTATIRLNTALEAEKVLIHIPDGVVSDLAGNSLDGDWNR